MLRTIRAILLAIPLSGQAGGRPKKSKFLLLSNLHFNPLADPVLVKDLDLDLKPPNQRGGRRSSIAHYRTR